MSPRSRHHTITLLNGIVAIAVIAMAGVYVAMEHLRSSVITPPTNNPPLIITNAPGYTYHAYVGSKTDLLMVAMDPDGLVILQPSNTIKTADFDVVQSINQLIFTTVDYHPAPLPEYTIPIARGEWTPTISDVGMHTMKLRPYKHLPSGLRMDGPLTTINIEVENLSNQELLQRAVDNGLTTKTTLAEFLNALPFDDIFQRMTNEEVATALINNGIITRTSSVQEVLSTAYNPSIPYGTLKPYGLLQALSLPVRNGSLLRQKREPWYIVQDAYDDLKAAFNANKFSLLNVLTPARMFALIDDRIAPANGADKPFTMYTNDRPNNTTNTPTPSMVKRADIGGPDYANHETEAQYRSRFPQMAAALKVKTDAMPEGKRVVKLGGIERLSGGILNGGIFPPLRDAQGAIVSDDNCLDAIAQYKADYNMNSLWFDAYPATQWNGGDDWYNIVRSRMSEFFRIYKSIGGKVDLIQSDIEEDFLSLYEAQCIWKTGKQNYILSNVQWPTLWQQLQEIGISSLDNIANWYPNKREWRSVLWDTLMERRQVQAYKEAMVDPIRYDVNNNNAPLFPSVIFTEYEFFFRSNLIPFTSFRKYPRNIENVGTILGDRQVINIYGGAGTIDAPDRIIDAPSDTSHPTMFETLVNDVMHMRTMATSSTVSIIPWVPHPLWQYAVTVLPNQGDTAPSEALTGTSTYDVPFSEIEEFFFERMFHIGLTNTDDFLNWTLSKLKQQISNQDFDDGFKTMQQSLTELDAMIGYSDRTALPSTRPDFQDGYILSGMEVHGKRVWRFTPDPSIINGIAVHTHDVRSTADGATELVVDGAVIKRIPHSSFTQDHLGYWITQYDTDSLFTLPASEVMQLL